MSNSREQFEAHFPLPEHVRWDGEQYLCDNRYQIRAFLTYHEQWDVWQASRQALVVNLPESFTLGDGYGSGLDPEDTCEAIKAAGVRVKS